MTTATAIPAHDFYDPDAVIPRNSPVLIATKVNTRPSPSPELDVPLVQVSPPSNTRSGKAKKRPKVRPSQGDAVLIGIMGNGRDPDIARDAGLRPLPSDEDEVTSPGSDDDTDERERTSPSPDCHLASIGRKAEMPPSPPNDLKMLADNALAALDLNRKSVSDDGRTPTTAGDADTEISRTMVSPTSPTARPQTAVRNDRPHPVYPTPYSPGSMYTPRTGSFASPTASLGHESLPPIQNASPRSESNAGISLPSLKDQLGPEALSPSFSHSPPGPGMLHGMSRLPSMSHASPPISPHELIPRSPHQPIMPPGPYAPWPPNGLSHRASIDYTSGSTPSDQSASTPATSASVTERMSIEGMAFANSPEQGQYVCTVEGCKAPPFQTQYLLNSHANVHSQSRPHYCPVKDCPRAEGGKGFKRKNEMIRHGLVHESPGYVCPFCPDREHRYPRPDNLQRYVQRRKTLTAGQWGLILCRHVRVHHPDKDKDDGQLRDVLSQRPDGPSRGRRRRGVS